MSNCIRLLSATALLAIVLPSHAQQSAATTAADAPAATPPVALAWPLELKEGRRAWSKTDLDMKDPFKSKAPSTKVPANTELRLHDSMTRNGVELWKVEAVASKVEGWTPADTLTRTWPKTDADAPVAMLGDRSAEIAALQARIQSKEVLERIAAYRDVYGSPGLADEKLYDAMARILIRGMARAGAMNAQAWGTVSQATGGWIWATFAGDDPETLAAAGQITQMDRKRWTQEVSWLTKALASSGLARYRPLLERATELDSITMGNISDHANTALDNLETHARWNRIVNDPAGHKPDQSHAQTRLANMLRSGEQALVRAALDEAARKKETPLFDVVEAEFKSLNRQPLDEDQSDTVAIMAKTIGRSGDVKYRATLADAAANASTKDVKKMATRMVEELDEAAKKR